MADARLRAWIRQAQADLEAGNVGNGPDCHRRYWLQQACEKGIKALGLLLWRDQTNDGLFRAHFLYKHSPLRQLTMAVNADPSLPKSLRLLLRQIETELGHLDGEGLLRRVDGTTPTTNPSDVSYRYPFVDVTSDEVVAPQDWPATNWDAYQGNAQGVSAAIRRFLSAIDNRRRQARGHI